MNQISIQKVRLKDKLTEIIYNSSVLTDDEEFVHTEHTFASNVVPHKDFYKAFQNLKKHGINICEIKLFGDETESLAKHIVTSVKIKEGSEDNFAMISLNKFIKNGKCYSVTTPLIDLENEDYKELDELNADLEILKNEAINCINGKNGNQQMELDFFQHKAVLV